MEKSVKRDELMSIEGEKEVGELKKMFKARCTKENSIYEQLLPLVGLIPTIQSIAEEKKLNMEVNKRIAAIVAKIMRIAGLISVGLGTLFLIIQLIFKLKD